jgi:hypothetical protein
MQQLVVMRLSYMNVSGPMPAPSWPASSSGMTQLIHVCLRWFPSVSGDLAGLLNWLSGRPQLTNLYLSNLGSVANNSAQHPVLEALPMVFPNLQELELTQLGLPGTLPASWWRLFDAPATHMYLYSNNLLRGRIPASWTNDAGSPTNTPASLVNADFS